MSPSRPGTAPAVIVVSSHVVRGSVGNRAAVFALETLGFPVWAVPTVILPWHPGHGRATRIVPDPAAFAAMLRDLEMAPWLGEVGAVLSGYLGEASQADAVAALVRAVKARNRDAIYACDPVIGDQGGLYVPPATAEAMRDMLLPICDLATPNRHELAWLTGMETGTLDAAAHAALSLARERVLVTSAPAPLAGSTGNLLVERGRCLLAEHRAVERPPNGPGDLTAALFLAHLLAGRASAEALKSTTAAVFEILARATTRGADELMLETDAASLANPMALVQMHEVPTPGGGLVA